ncbi:uncharacterized protein LOC135482276 [Liolophura sinensis]|uniref:uncharacterized protein LOC135482276 n=1 Tax=Liolophura sinensis TaxID=3198878 RepID=UPI003158A87F
MSREEKLSSKRQAIVAGIFGVVTVISGIVSTVLYYYFLKNFYENTLMHDAPQFDFWWTPVPFIVPGILGIVAAVQRNKPLFALYLAMAIMTLLVTGIFFVIIVMFVVKIPSEYSRAECRDSGLECHCMRDMTDVFSKAMGYRNCDKMMDMAVYGHVATGIYTLAWVLCFAGAMLSSFTCCYIEKQRARAIVAFKDRHCPSFRVSNVQPGRTENRRTDNRRTGADNLAYVYF